MSVIFLTFHSRWKVYVAANVNKLEIIINIHVYVHHPRGIGSPFHFQDVISGHSVSLFVCVYVAFQFCLFFTCAYHELFRLRDWNLLLQKIAFHFQNYYINYIILIPKYKINWMAIFLIFAIHSSIHNYLLVTKKYAESPTIFNNILIYQGNRTLCTLTVHSVCTLSIPLTVHSVCTLSVPVFI